MDLETMRHEYELARQYTLRLYEDLDESTVMWRPSYQGSSIGWHLGHQAAVNHYVLRNWVNRDGSIGTPLGNAVGYACWHVARHLVDRGARVDRPWHAAALGLLSRLEELLGDQPSRAEVSEAFWHACSGGQRRAAEHLLSRGADLNWIPEYAAGTPLAAATGRGTRRENVIGWLRDLGARAADPDQ